jgi:DUF4097 and DUF4098 domain-containing protein YvlB
MKRAMKALNLRIQIPRRRSSVPPILPGAPRSDCTGPEQTERFSRKLRLARAGSVTVGNISGDMVVTGGSGDDVSIEAIKRTRCESSQLSAVQITVEERAGRVGVETEYPRYKSGVNVSVDYTITVPSWAAIELHSVSGDVKVTAVQGATRVESVSGNIATSDTPKLEMAKSVSGDVDLIGARDVGDLTAGTVSGNVRAKDVKARNVSINTISGKVMLTDVSTDRLAAKTLSGDVSYAGSLAKGGRYELTTHSGQVRLMLTSGVGFELDANTFSGLIRSDLPLTLTGDIRSRGPRNSLTHATFGDGSAALSIRTFSGDIVITK